VNHVPQDSPGEPIFNPLSPEVIADPYPVYHRLRTTDPVHRSPLGFLVLSRHADVSSVLRDKRFGRDFVGRMTRRHGSRIFDEPVYRSLRHWMLHQDPPEHTRLRSLVVQAFSARRIDNMRPRIQEIVDRTLDRMAPRRQADLIADFALHLPVTVISEMLGIPRDHHPIIFDRLGRRDDAQDGAADRAALDRLANPPSHDESADRLQPSRAELDAANSGNLAVSEYFRQLIALRRRQPRDDLTTQLVQAEEHGHRLSDEEIIGNIILLFGAGHETTVNLIGNAVLALYRHPDQLRLLRDEPALMPNAVEELLRYDSAIQLSGRAALADVAIGGAEVAKGESVLCLLGSANRDPAAYQEPDRLGIRRANIRPLSFGGGMHYCLGAQLARIETEIAISTLLRRLPGLTLDPGKADWRPTFIHRGLKRLPAIW
jgi:cytochrome P450